MKSGLTSSYDFRLDFSLTSGYDLQTGHNLRLWLPVWLPVLISSKIFDQFWFSLPVMTSVFTTGMTSSLTSGYDFWFDFRSWLLVWLPAQLQAIAMAQQTMLDMEKKGFFHIRISYKLKILCKTQLSAEDRSFILYLIMYILTVISPISF